MITWFKGQGCYVMGGVPTYWRTGVNDSRPGYLRLTADGGRMLKGQLPLTANRPTPPVLSGDGQPPSVPTSLRASGHTESTVSLAWNASSDNIGVSGYRVFQVNGSATTLVGSTAATTFTAGGLTSATTYTFAVSAQDAGGNSSALSAPVTVTTDASTANLALHRPTSESSHTQVYASGNAVDADSNSYWESANNAFPQWLQVDLGAVTGIRRIVLTLPPSSAWSARTQTLSVLGGTDGTNFGTVVAPAGYTFDPATGNTATITLPASATVRHVRLSFTANTGWPAGQVSELRVFAS